MNMFFLSYRNWILKRSGIKWSEIAAWFLPLAAARLVAGNLPREQHELLMIIKNELARIHGNQ